MLSSPSYLLLEQAVLKEGGDPETKSCWLQLLHLIWVTFLAVLLQCSTVCVGGGGGGGGFDKVLLKVQLHAPSTGRCLRSHTSDTPLPIFL